MEHRSMLGSELGERPDLPAATIDDRQRIGPVQQCQPELVPLGRFRVRSVVDEDADRAAADRVLEDIGRIPDHPLPPVLEMLGDEPAGPRVGIDADDAGIGSALARVALGCHEQHE
jgi:hypothetical protein